MKKSNWVEKWKERRMKTWGGDEIHDADFIDDIRAFQRALIRRIRNNARLTHHLNHRAVEIVEKIIKGEE